MPISSFHVHSIKCCMRKTLPNLRPRKLKCWHPLPTPTLADYKTKRVVTFLTWLPRSWYVILFLYMLEIFLKKKWKKKFFLQPTDHSGVKAKWKHFKQKANKSHGETPGQITRLVSFLFCCVFCQNWGLGVRNKDRLIEKHYSTQDSFSCKCQNLNSDSFKKNKTECMAHKAEKFEGHSPFRHSGM